MKRIQIAAMVASVIILTGCNSDAEVASRNLSKAADMFEINRRIIFYNGITGEYMLNIEGRCSIGSGQSTNSVTVTCKTGENQFKKHFLGLSDNVTYFAEQLGYADVSVYHHRVIFKPQTILPDIDFRGSVEGMGQLLPDSSDN
jgi:uncharacterized lipoprotein NlpE involved in copper resistance